jgi:26S proteasome regulatory subunit T1
VTNLEQNEVFAAELEDLVVSRANDVPTMAKGYIFTLDSSIGTLDSNPLNRFQECSRYMSSTQISNFLDGAIRNRISVRLIAEQHIALSRALNNPSGKHNITHSGIVDMACSPSDMITMCGTFVSELCESTLGTSPPLMIDGHKNATFPCVLTFDSSRHRTNQL